MNKNKTRIHFFSLINAYFLFWFAAAAFLPYLSVYYESHDFTGEQIGLLISIPYMVTAASSFLFGFVADLIKKPVMILRLCSLGFLTALILLSRTNSFLMTAFSCLTYAVFSAPMNPILDKVTLDILSNPAQYGRVRIGGSIGWGLGVMVISYLLSDWHFPMMFAVSELLLFLFLINTLIFPMKAALTDHQEIKLKDMGTFIKRKTTVVLLLGNIIWGIAESCITGYLFLHIKMLGGSSLMMGLSMAFAILSEIISFLIVDKVMKRFSLSAMMICAFFLQFLRLCSLSLIKDPAILVPFQFFGGASFTLIWSASVAYINKGVNKEMQTAGQALKSGVMSIGSSISVFLGGYIYEMHGSTKLFSSVVWLIFAAMLIGITISFRWRIPFRKSLT